MSKIAANRLLYLFLIIFPSFLFAQNEQQSIYEYFVSGDMTKWKTTMDNMAAKRLTSSQELNLINYYYGYIGYQLGVGNKSEAGKYVSKGEDLIDKLIKSQPKNADLYAYKGAFIGFKIGISPIKAPFIGKSSIENVKKALEIDPNNIQGNIEQANVLYYSPSAFGGDKAKAKTYYNKAIALFEKNESAKNKNWLYLSLMTAVAQIYTSEKNYNAAKQMYEKILSIEPNYSYVKKELYPQLIKKMK